MATNPDIPSTGHPRQQCQRCRQKNLHNCNWPQSPCNNCLGQLGTHGRQIDCTRPGRAVPHPSAVRSTLEALGHSSSGDHRASDSSRGGSTRGGSGHGRGSYHARGARGAGQAGYYGRDRYQSRGGLQSQGHPPHSGPPPGTPTGPRATRPSGVPPAPPPGPAATRTANPAAALVTHHPGPSASAQTALPAASQQTAQAPVVVVYASNPPGNSANPPDDLQERMERLEAQLQKANEKIKEQELESRKRRRSLGGDDTEPSKKARQSQMPPALPRGPRERPMPQMTPLAPRRVPPQAPGQQQQPRPRQAQGATVGYMGPFSVTDSARRQSGSNRFRPRPQPRESLTTRQQQQHEANPPEEGDPASSGSEEL